MRRKSSRIRKRRGDSIARAQVDERKVYNRVTAVDILEFSIYLALRYHQFGTMRIDQTTNNVFVI